MNVDREVLKIALRGKSNEVVYGYIESIHCDGTNAYSNTKTSTKTTVTFVTYQDDISTLMNEDLATLTGKVIPSFALVRSPHGS